MFEFILYIAVTVTVLAFVGNGSAPSEFLEGIEILEEGYAEMIEVAEVHTLESLETLFDEPLHYAASEMPSDVCLVVPVAEFTQALDQAKHHDIATAEPKWIREQCKLHGIAVAARGKIGKATIEALAAKL